MTDDEIFEAWVFANTLKQYIPKKLPSVKDDMDWHLKKRLWLIAHTKRVQKGDSSDPLGLHLRYKTI